MPRKPWAESGAIFRTSSYKASTGQSVHRHSHGYIALIRTGGYREISVDGSFVSRRGVAIVHPAWHEHSTSFGARASLVLDVPIGEHLPYRVAALSDYRLRQACTLRCRHDLLDLIETHGEPLQPLPVPGRVAEMMAELRYAPDSRIDELAEVLKVSVEHASREFRRHTGFSPTGFRGEFRLRQALAGLRKGGAQIDVADECGFSDQSHLSRVLKAATGLVASRLQASDLFKNPPQYRS